MAGAEENVVIMAGDCQVTFLPALGGKIASILIRGHEIQDHELMQAPLHPYGPRTHTMPFSESDASGWDECLPSVAECTVATGAGIAAIPDHGDLWRVPWQMLAKSHDSATLRATGFSLPLQLTRSVIVSETSSGWLLQLLYSLTNLGAYVVPWSWAAHPLFAVDAGDRIVLPTGIDSLLVEGSAGGTLGPAGQSIEWPRTKRTDGSISDLNIAQSLQSGIGDKLFAGPMLENAWAALERPGIGLRLTVRFEPALTPYLGLWLCYGGWPEEPGLKQMCVALEPTTAPVDSLARTGLWSRSLDPGETFTWPMELAIDRISTGDD